MAITLFDATVPTYLQYLRSTAHVLEKGLEHAQSIGVDPDSLVEARLTEDMRALRFQIQRVCDFSAGALRDVAKGAFTYPGPDPDTYAGLQALIAEAQATVAGWTPEAVNAYEGREVVLETHSFKQSFTAENFLFSFAMPNFFFHAVTAYDILRVQGVPVGKRHYLGRLRFTGAEV